MTFIYTFSSSKKVKVSVEPPDRGSCYPLISIRAAQDPDISASFIIPVEAIDKEVLSEAVLELSKLLDSRDKIKVMAMLAKAIEGEQI